MSDDDNDDDEYLQRNEEEEFEELRASDYLERVRALQDEFHSLYSTYRSTYYE